LDGGGLMFIWIGGKNVRSLDLKKGMEALQYFAEQTNRGEQNIYIVEKGKEPWEFISYFIGWEVTEKEIKEGDGALIGLKLSELKPAVVKQRLALYLKNWTWKELAGKPAELDHGALESYMDDQEFERVFQCNKYTFYAMPYWKQVNLKKDKFLF